MLKYFMVISKNVRICYNVSAAAFLIMFGLSYAVLSNIDPRVLGMAHIILVILAILVVGVAAVVLAFFMKNTVIVHGINLRAPNNLLYHIKRIISLSVLITCVGLALSFAGGFLAMASLDIFTSLRTDNFNLYCTVIKIPMFMIYIGFLIFIAKHIGTEDTAFKAFNPHFILMTLILAVAFMLPITVSSHMYENTDDRGNYYHVQSIRRSGASSVGKIFYNVQSVFSNNEDYLYKDKDLNYTVNEKYSIVRVIISILASVAIQIAAAMIGYSKGRKKLLSKYPNRSEEEIYSFLPEIPDNTNRSSRR